MCNANIDMTVLCTQCIVLWAEYRVSKAGLKMRKLGSMLFIRANLIQCSPLKQPAFVRPVFDRKNGLAVYSSKFD